MKEFEYILLLGIFTMVTLGMATVPKAPTISVSYNQKVTPFVNNIIQGCLADCGSGNNCTKICNEETAFEIGRDHDQIINKYGNVL